MRPFRIVVARIPKLLREIVVDTLAQEEDMEVLAEVAGDAELAELMAGVCPDIMVAGCEPGELGSAFDEVLLWHPRLRILAISGSARRAFLYQLRPSVRELDEVSPQGLLRAIRHPDWGGTVPSCTGDATMGSRG